MTRFGPSGNSKSFYEEGHRSSVEMPSWLSRMGLDAYEYNCSKGVKVKRETAGEIGREAEKNGIFLSIHAPYYISMASRDTKKRENSVRYMMESLRAAKWMGAERVVVHAGSCSGMERREALDIAEGILAKTLKKADDEGLSDISLCPEVLGKKNQLGTLDEVLHMCMLDDRLVPTVDFAHIHARTGGTLDSPGAFDRVFEKIERELGCKRTRNLHIHFSRIEFTPGGEKRHMRLEDTEYGPEFLHLAQVINERGIEPVIICESRGVMAEDALRMKGTYMKIMEGCE